MARRSPVPNPVLGASFSSGLVQGVEGRGGLMEGVVVQPNNRITNYPLNSDISLKRRDGGCQVEKLMGNTIVNPSDHPALAYSAEVVFSYEGRAGTPPC